MAEIIRLRAGALTSAAFAPFGDVVDYTGTERRHFLEVPLESNRQGMRFWTSRPAPVALPLRIRQLERHPHSPQTFVPTTTTRFLVVVAPPTDGPMPDPGAVQAFIAGPGQGIAYRTGTWHTGMAALDEAAVFAVMMALTGRDEDTELVDLPAALEITP